MKTFYQIINQELIEKKEKSFTLDQINMALLKVGVGPKIIVQFMNALNILRGLGIMEAKDENL